MQHSKGNLANIPELFLFFCTGYIFLDNAYSLVCTNKGVTEGSMMGDCFSKEIIDSTLRLMVLFEGGFKDL